MADLGFELVWQYGSNESDPLWLQDGIAPQCPVGGIGTNRSYIEDYDIKGFDISHYIDNYDWIFNLIGRKC